MYLDDYKIIIDSIDLVSNSFSIIVQHQIKDDQGNIVANVSKERRAFMREEGAEFVADWVEEKSIEKGIDIKKDKVTSVINSLWTENVK